MKRSFIKAYTHWASKDHVPDPQPSSLIYIDATWIRLFFGCADGEWTQATVEGGHVLTTLFLPVTPAELKRVLESL